MVKSIFEHFFLFEKIFVALFKTFGMQKADRSHFAGVVSEQVEMQKGSFQRMV